MESVHSGEKDGRKGGESEKGKGDEESMVKIQRSHSMTRACQEVQCREVRCS